MDRVITRTELVAQVGILGRTRQIIAPVAQPAYGCDPPVRYFYREIVDPQLIAFEFDTCVYGPKAVVCPPRETLFRFDRTLSTFVATPVLDDRPRALVGVHPCDLHALATLDTVFLQDHPDEHYLRRRKNLMLVGVDCSTPCTAEAFCVDMQTSETSEFCDVMLHALNPSPTQNGPSEWVFGATLITPIGRDWLAQAGRRARPADEHSLDDCRAAKSRAFARRLKTVPNRLPDILNQTRHSRIWGDTADRCYSCGSCTLVCPTCYCFDVRDETSLDASTGLRQREWDSCMLRDFAVVAGGHDFRATAEKRLRHRIHRKLAWIRARTGQAGCVGCGRCSRACTAKIDIVEIANSLSEEAEHAC